jgi:hypothetical protein
MIRTHKFFIVGSAQIPAGVGDYKPEPVAARELKPTSEDAKDLKPKVVSATEES